MAKATGLPAIQRRALARLSKLPSAAHLYLAGGSGLALHLRHRVSNDLDLFARPSELDFAGFEKELRQVTKEVELVSQSDATLHLRLEGVEVDLVRYDFEPVTPPRMSEAGIRLASLRDLAAMKLAAISRRGVRRDFWDLHAILQSRRVSLARALDDFRQKFRLAEADTYHVLRALSWFDDAERDEAFPRGLTRAHWQVIKADLEAAARREARRRAGLGKR